MKRKKRRKLKWDDTRKRIVKIFRVLLGLFFLFIAIMKSIHYPEMGGLLTIISRLLLAYCFFFIWNEDENSQNPKFSRSVEKRLFVDESAEYRKISCWKSNNNSNHPQVMSTWKIVLIVLLCLLILYLILKWRGIDLFELVFDGISDLLKFLFSP